MEEFVLLIVGAALGAVGTYLVQNKLQRSEADHAINGIGSRAPILRLVNIERA